MNKKTFASKLYYRFCCFVLFFVAAAASFNGSYDKWHFREAGTQGPMGYSGARSICSFDAMVDGTAWRPYVYRQLLPMLANWIDQRVPERTKDWLFAGNIRTATLLRQQFSSSSVEENRAYFLRYWIVYVVDFLFAWAAVYAMYLLCKAVGFAPVIAAFSAIIMILLMPYFMSMGGGYFYDYPELAFLALVAWMALKFDWWWMIPVVALASWNKESFLLFIPALYPLLRLRNSRLNALIGTGILELTCAAVYFVIKLHFQHNPGGTVEMHLMDQIDLLLHPARLLYMEKTYGVIVLRSFNPLSVVLILWTLWRGWHSLPRAIQRHAQIAAAINIPLFILFCASGELRDLSLLYIAFLLLLATNLAAWAGNQTKAEAQLSA